MQLRLLGLHTGALLGTVGLGEWDDMYQTMTQSPVLWRKENLILVVDAIEIHLLQQTARVEVGNK